MRKTILFGLALLVAFGAGVSAQKPFRSVKKATPYTLMFYNTENLFDTIDDPYCNDWEFLPESNNLWGEDRYHIKLNNVARVLSSADTVNLPMIIGLAEIENRGVLEDLINQPSLIKGNYGIVHQECSDPRCIDVALLFRRDLFSLISFSLIPIYYHDSSNISTRECLYVCGRVNNADTLHVIINHWKSRTGGTEKTEWKRLVYARTIRHFIDSIFTVRPYANIVLMGDFNDTPDDISIKDELKALPVQPKLNNCSLYNVSKTIADEGGGSHYYKGWELFDHIMVSTHLLSAKKRGLFCAKKALVFQPDWLLYQNSKGEMVPARTFASGKYFGGYSDHLAVMVRLWVRK